MDLRSRRSLVCGPCSTKLVAAAPPVAPPRRASLRRPSLGGDGVRACDACYNQCAAAAADAVGAGQNRLAAADALAEGLEGMRERGERIEHLHDAAGELHDVCRNFRDHARRLRQDAEARRNKGKVW